MKLPWRAAAGAPRPWATWALLVATLLMQLVGIGSPDLVWQLGIVPAAPSASGLLAHLFFHAGWLHVFGTLAFVALAGPWLEQKLGRALFVAAYVAAGLAGATLFVAGATFFVAGNPAHDAPWIGGSAAVAGLLGLLLASAGKGRIELLGVAAGLAPRLSVPVWTLVAFWLGRELAGFAANGTSGLVAHLGSFAFGAALALGLRRTGIVVAEAVVEEPERAAAPRPRVRRAPALRLPVPKDPARLEALLAEAGDPELARAVLAGAEAEGRGDAARAKLVERLWEAVESLRREPAVALWCALFETGSLPSGASEPLLQLASWLRSGGRIAESNAALHAALSGADTAAAGKLARATRRSAPVIAVRAAERALADASLAPSDRKALEGLMVEAQREVTARGVILVPEAARAAPKPEPEASPGRASRGREAETSREPPRRRRLGEAIELAPEPAPLAMALPDPAQAGEVAFLDAFHAALCEPPADAAKGRSEPPLRRLRVREAVPRAFETDALRLEVPGRGSVRLPLEKLHAVVLAGVRGLSERAGDKPVLLLDLCLSAEAEPELHLLRLRSDRFDPRQLCPEAETSPLKALRGFAAALATRAHAALLPEGEVVGEVPLRIFRDLATYEREVLRARQQGDGPHPSVAGK